MLAICVSDPFVIAGTVFTLTIFSVTAVIIFLLCHFPTHSMAEFLQVLVTEYDLPDVDIKHVMQLVKTKQSKVYTTEDSITQVKW